MRCHFAGAKVVHRNKGEVLWLQVKITCVLVVNTFVAPASAQHIDRVRRQGSPAAMLAAHPPGHPCRSPLPVRTPHPPTAFVVMPAAIMKRRPAPRIMRLPVPAAVGVNPMAPI